MARFAFIKRTLLNLIGHKVAPKDKNQLERVATAAEMQTCDGNFIEHRMFLEDLIRIYPNSGISCQNPAKSLGR